MLNLQNILQQVDQFDGASAELHGTETLDKTALTETTSELEKRAHRLLSRRQELEGADESNFGLIIFNGRERFPKYPIATRQDVMESYEALEKNAAHLPDELVKTARYHIELAGREKVGRSLYGADGAELIKSAAILTNVVYTGEIDQEAYREKREGLRKTASTGETVVYLLPGRYPVMTQEHIKIAERMIAGRQLGLSPRDEYDASRALLKQAKALGVELTQRGVLRYERERMPNKVASALEYRRFLTKDDRARKLYERFEKAANDLSLIDAAECLEAIDKLARLVPMAGEKLANSRLDQSAYDVIFPLEEEQTGLNEDTIQKIASVFGRAFADHYVETGEVSGLTASERHVLDNLINQ